MTEPTFDVINLLDKKGLSFTLHRNCETSITFVVTSVGKRIEIYVHEDGVVDFSVFRGTEEVMIGMDALNDELDLE